MTRQEFMETLGKILRRELTEAGVAENLQYYEEYIDQEVSQGKSEEQVLAALGDPRLIAMTILQVEQQRETDAFEGRGGTVYTESPDGTYRESSDGSYGEFGGGFGHSTEDNGTGKPSGMRSFQIKGWMAGLVVILILVILCVIIGTVFAIVWRLLPIILVVCFFLWLIRRFRS